MIRSKKVKIAFTAAVSSVALACGVVFLNPAKHTALAYDGLPGEFGEKIGEVIEDSTGKYVNYERGYVKYAADATDTGNPNQAVAHVGGKNVKSEGGTLSFELVSAEKMTSVKNWDTIVDVNNSGNRIAYGPGWNADAAQKVGNAFKTEWSALIEQEYNLGIPCSNINLYTGGGDGDAVVFGMEFRYGDSTWDNDNGSGGRKNMTYLFYNVLNDEVYRVTDAFVRLTGGEANELRRIGAPVSNQIEGVTVTGTDGENNTINVTGKTVQVFETGILIEGEKSEGRVEKHEGVVEKISETEYKMHPIVRDQDILRDGFTFIGDVDGTWHALRTARTSRENGKLAVEYNFRAGCIKVVYNDNYSLDSRMAYAGQNFTYDEEGNSSRVMLPKENFTTDEHLWENRDDGVDSSALNMFRSLSGNANATKNDVKDAFRAGYMAMLEEGIIPGYRCSWIKTWDVLCVDYKYSPDSMYGFDGVGSAGRERMFTLAYSGVQKKVYGVGDVFFNTWRDDSIRRALGAPISNELKDVTISGMHFNRIQIFEQGYIYESDGGKIVTEYGVTTDNEYKEFKFKAAPTEKPQQYGAEKERFEVTEAGKSVVYINYEKGAVKATEMNTKTGYLYDYFPGRNFTETNGVYKANLLSYNDLYNNDEFNCDSSLDAIFNNGGLDEESGEYVDSVKQQIINKVKELLNNGFFPGFFEGKFQSWNLALGQQFIYGDSTGQPWGGDSRTNVCALVYNQKEGKVFLLKDAFMDLWGGTKGAYNQLGAPASDEFTVAGNDNVKFQYFYGTSTQNNLAFAVSVGYNEATCYTPSDLVAQSVNPEQYLKDLTELSKPLSGIKIEAPESTTVSVGSYEDIEYIIDGAGADATIVITSSDESIAEVMADGSVEFHKKGKVTITVIVSDGVNSFSDSITFNVVKGGRAVAAGTLGSNNGGNGLLIGSLCGAGALLALGTAAVAIKLRKDKVR